MGEHIFTLGPWTKVKIGQSQCSRQLLIPPQCVSTDIPEISKNHKNLMTSSIRFYGKKEIAVESQIRVTKWMSKVRLRRGATI